MGSLSTQVFEFNLTTTAAADAGLVDVIPTLAREIDGLVNGETNMAFPMDQVTLNGASISAVPEPSTVLLIAIGIIAIARRFFLKLPAHGYPDRRDNVAQRCVQA